MKIVSIFLILSILMFSCRPIKKVQKIQEVVPEVDTALVVKVTDIITSNNSDAAKNPTLPTSRDIFEKVTKNKIVFNTFNSKVRIHYEGNESEDDATAYIRLKRDSIMWLSLRGPLGIEGFRVLISKDSVKVMNLLKKNVEFKGINYLEEITGIPLNFFTLQDLVVGNPIFIDSNIISHQLTADNRLFISMAGTTFKHLISLDNTSLKVLHSKLEDVDANRNRTCNITFSDYDNSSGVYFSTKRNMSVTDQTKLDVHLEFKQYSFNQQLTFPFNVPKNYKRLN